MADVKEISFGNTTLKFKDESARNSIGSGTLETTAQNLIGATNEINTAKLSEAYVNDLGCKNLLHITGVTTIINGVTFTVNRNDSGECTSIVANGTASGDGAFLIGVVSNEYIGCVVNGITGGSSSTYEIFIRHQNAEGDYIAEQNVHNGDVIIENKGNNVKSIAFRIRIKNGYHFDNVPFYPMIRPAYIKDSTFVPYAKSNQELTEAVSNLSFLKVANGALCVEYNQ